MSWKLLDRPKTQKVTRKLAQMFAGMDPAPHDRPLSERRLMVYQRLLAEGGFRPVTWASATCVETGGLYRVNGKHTSTLLAGADPLPEFYAVVEEYECDTLEDVARLYATFDSNLQSRSARDIYLSFASTIPALKDIPANHIVLAIIGIALHVNGGTNPSSSTAPDRAEAILEHPEYARWLSHVLGGGGVKTGKHLLRSPVTGAMFGTYQKSQKDSDNFWTAVRDETGTTPNLPDRKLARYLLTSGVQVAKGSARALSSSPREMYVRCLHAWNAWRRQEATDLKYYADKDIPVIR